MTKGSLYREAEEEEEETESDEDDEIREGAEEDESESEGEIGERRKRIMIRVVSGRRIGGGEIEPESFSGDGGGGSVCCQADECSINLSLAKKYHRRHKVCERHAKAAVVLVAGVRQRFCQQCSRFHEISQFDDTKRSCRRRLAGHNMRRRKASSAAEEEPSAVPEVKCGSRHHNYNGKHFRAR